MADPKCQCAGCCARRAAQARHFAKHKAKILKKNAAWKRGRAARSSPEVSDEEMDRRALEMERTANV